MKLIPLNFNENKVRSVIGDNGEPLFNAKDVCDCLGLGNPTRALSSLDSEDLTLLKVRSGTQKREMNFVNESALYELVFKSRKAEARTFTRWVTREVLPAIRKTGSYSVDGFDMMKFYKEYGKLNPNYEFIIEFKDVRAVAYRDITHSFLISSAELAKLIGKSPQTIRVLKAYHKDIIQSGDAFVKLGENTYWTKKGVEIMSLHSNNKEFAEHVHGGEFNTKLLSA